MSLRPALDEADWIELYDPLQSDTQTGLRPPFYSPFIGVFKSIRPFTNNIFVSCCFEYKHVLGTSRSSLYFGGRCKPAFSFKSIRQTTASCGLLGRVLT